MRVEIDGKFYRLRRGRLVPIPAKWVNKVTTPATIRQRPSKLSRKVRRYDVTSTSKLMACTKFKDQRDAQIDLVQDD